MHLSSAFESHAPRATILVRLPVGWVFPTDICMWLGALFLILVGAGPWALDSRSLAPPLVED